MSESESKQDDPNKMHTITELEAVGENKIEQLRNSLRRHGIPENVAVTDRSYSLLQMAIKNKETELAKFFIKTGFPVNPGDKDTDNSDYTPLALAILTENEEIAMLLLDKGASLNVIAGDNSDLTALHLGAQMVASKMLEFLQCFLVEDEKLFQAFLENCIHIRETDNIIVIKNLLSQGASMDFQSTDGQTVLHYVVKTKRCDIIEDVLNATINVNEQCNRRNTPLHSLLDEVHPIEESILEVVICLVANDAKLTIQNNRGDTVCHLAAKKKYLQILQIFIECKWDVNCCNQVGNTVLHYLLTDSIDLINNIQFFQIVYHILEQNSLKWIRNIKGETAIHIAAENRQSQILSVMLSKPVAINAVDQYGNTVLYNYMKNLVDKKIVPDKDDIDIVEEMISVGANPAFCHRYTKDSPMHLALKLKNEQIIWHMLEYNFDFDRFDISKKSSILHYLCDQKLNTTETDQLLMAEVAEICILKGATVDVRDPYSKTPLYWAALLRQKHLVRTLLQYGADPNLVDNEGRTILENLINKEEDEKRQIPVDTERDSEIAQMLLLKNANAGNVSDGQVSIFHYCAVNSHLDMLHNIISYCQDADICDTRQNTILHTLLANNPNKSEEVEKTVADIVVILLMIGTNISAVNEHGETPLHLAAKSKHLKVCEILLQQEASVADLDNYGNSVLHFLCMLQSKTNDSVEKELTNLFINKGCDVNFRNKTGMTPLLFAAKTGSANMMKILISLNAKVDCVENENLSLPIHLAAENHQEEVIEQLIKWRVDVNARRRDRKTPLHLSVAHKSSMVSRLLLASGAFADLKDCQGKTPLHWACEHDSLDNISELLDYGADLNAEDNFNVTPFMLTKQINYAWLKLHYHLVKLKAANIPVSNRNKEHEKEYEEYFDMLEIRKFENVATEEILKMKRILVAPTTSLADVLLMSPNKLSVFKNNEDFQRIFNSEDFKDKFPIYADLVRACYRKGIIRSDLIISAKNGFSKILGLVLPDTCYDAIFDYLDNESLYNLSKAAEIRAFKRKRFAAEIHEGISAKKVKESA